MPRRRRAVTIVEILIVVLILGGMVALLLPAIQASCEAARSTHCASNLKQIGIALHTYHARFRSFPPGYVTKVDRVDFDDLGPGWSWGTFLFSDLEFSNHLPSLDFRSSPASESNRLVTRMHLPDFACPSDDVFDELVDIPSYAPTGDTEKLAGANYVASVGSVRQTCKICRDKFDGVFGRNSRTRLEDILDGSSKTFAIGERTHRLSSPVWSGVVAKSYIVDHLIPGKFAAGPAYVLGSTFLHGDQSELEENSRDTVAEIFGSAHPSIMNFLLCDGSVRAIDVGIDDRVYMALSTSREQLPTGGIVHDSPWTQ